MRGSEQARLTAAKAVAFRVYLVFRQVVFLGLLAAGIVCFMNSSTLELAPFIGWILMFAGFWIVIFFHELGHAAATLACGWKIAVFVAGPVGFHVHNREIRWVPRSKRLELAGFVLPVPRSVTVWTRSRAVAIYASGPIVSLVLAGVLTAASIRWATPEQAGQFNLTWLAAGLTFFSLGTAFTTITPDRPGKHASDGQNILRSLRTPEAEWLKTRGLARLYALTRHKIRLRDLPLWMLEDARKAAEGNPELEQAVAALLIAIVLDSPPVDKQSARESIDRFRRMNGDSEWLACCDAYFTTIWEDDPVRGRALLWKGVVEEDLKPLALAARAAVLAKEGDRSNAERLLLEMRLATARRSAFTDLTFRDIQLQVEAALHAGPKAETARR